MQLAAAPAIAAVVGVANVVVSTDVMSAWSAKYLSATPIRVAFRRLSSTASNATSTAVHDACGRWWSSANPIAPAVNQK